MKYTTENELSSVVESFESGTISREDWGHAEHLIVASFYLSKNDLDAAYHKMRGGIFNLLKAFKVDLSKEMPYHETLTIFWLRTIEDFRKTTNACSEFEICCEITKSFDKHYPLKFYSRELLFSDAARAEFVEGDLQNQNDL